jgi:hypothetical protein
MRIRSGAIVPALCLLSGGSAIAFLPGAASAELSEDNMCGVAPGAIFGQRVHTREVGVPFTPPPATFIDTEILPPSNFIAIANWGDGTTAPATLDPVLDRCYQVSGPSHTYANPGTYSFSYTVHDVKTGLDHTLGAEQFQAYSDVPRMLGGPASRTIRATVGVPWSGVVVEFSVEPPTTPASDRAQIEWAPGEAPQAGTIAAQSNGIWTVSGSFTYWRPFSGTISVLLSRYDGTPLGRWATSRVSAGNLPHFRFLGQPILAGIPSVRRSSAYAVIFRLNRALPQTKSGRIEASLRAGGTVTSVASFGPHTAHDCYAAGGDALVASSPKPGRRYPFTLTIRGRSRASAHGQALMRRYVNFVGMLTGASKRLGC